MKADILQRTLPELKRPEFVKHISQSTHTPERLVVNQLTGMKATVFNGGKVQRVRDGVVRCWAGKIGKRGEWQMELGEMTCRCRKTKKAEMIQRILPGLDCPRS